MTTTGLRTATAPTWDGLCALMRDDLAVRPDDPFALDVLVVPSVGHRRFVSHALAETLGGVCAGIDFPTFSGLRHLVETSMGLAGPDPDPWNPDLLVAAVMATLEATWDEPWAAPLRAYVEGYGPRPGRRAELAVRVAQLFARYARRCSGLLLAWDEGDDRDALGAPLAAEAAWQPQVWRALVGALSPVEHPARRHRRVVAALR
ncbi:MAG: exodeoxyribonuclease V subunit gamma, partial [Actinomycetia bacterium]|nr:exodeoxyribonuclease V subunit gamma [Actinomycetes bacterium]